ncbi:MAG: HlyD family efflux transporter periplasmic adaptor subunit [Dysgonamonadaceae bacterium]|jgi:HlyD family secretion protein|nr:HlyD family efflux transporter periplasmic adaptor subunit [Dysgonamonadaceae bacterium]
MKTTIILLLAATTALVSSCGKEKGTRDASGTFEATEITVSAQSVGTIKELNLTEGESLTAGGTVGYIDTTQLFLKKAQLSATMKALGNRRHNVALQLAAVRQQIAQQESERTRFQHLLQSDAATPKQVDDIEASIEVLRKQLTAQTESLQNTNHSIDAEIAALRIQVEQIDDQIHNSILRSPVSGVVLMKYAEAGEFAGQGKALFKVADVENIYLRAYLTADQLTRIRRNEEVRVFSDFGRKEMREYAGTIVWISDKAEFTPRTILTKKERSNLVYAVKVAVRNDGYLKIGMYGELKFKS